MLAVISINSGEMLPPISSDYGGQFLHTATFKLKFNLIYSEMKSPELWLFDLIPKHLDLTCDDAI